MSEINLPEGNLHLLRDHITGNASTLKDNRGILADEECPQSLRTV